MRPYVEGMKTARNSARRKTATSSREAKRRSDPSTNKAGGWICFAPLAMTDGAYAALARPALASAKAQSSQCVSASTSLFSIVAPHQMRRPGGASR